MVDLRMDDFRSSTNRECRTKAFLLAGEALGLFVAHDRGDLATVRHFSSSVAGAELNVAIGLSRLGQRALFLSKVGDDPVGRKIRLKLQSNQISDKYLFKLDNRRTGLMMKSRVSEGDPEVVYWRHDSAASTIAPMDIREVDFDEIKAIHMTGILPALSDSCLEAAYEMVDIAKRNNIFLSFDPNVRISLWKDERMMRSRLNDFCSKADLVIPGRGEAAFLSQKDSLAAMGSFFIKNGARFVIIKDGVKGAYLTDGKHETYVSAFIVESVVDTVGAGDGFAAGVLSALAEGLPFARALERGCAIGAIQTQSESDNDGLPNSEELTNFIESHLQLQLREGNEIEQN